MPNWKKLITSGSSAVLSGLTLSDLSNQGSELTSIMINGSGVVGTRELSSTAFSTMDNYSSFTAAGDAGDDQTISSGNTLTLTGTNGITTTGAAGDSVDIALNATQTGITSILNTSLVTGRDSDNQIKYSTDDNIIFRVAGGDGVTFKASGEIEATSLDIEGDADINGTLEADVITVNGTALNTVIAGVTVANATTAAIATTSTVADTTDTTCYVGLWESATGNLGAKSDAGLTYNAGTGMLTATGLTGPLTGQAATVATITGLAPDTATTQATQAAITSAANLATVGTIGTGIWQGTEVGLGYGGTELVGETDGKIVVADGSGAPVHLDIGSSTAITILGTIGTGVWQGTEVGLGYGGTELVGETDGKIVVADGSGAPVHLDIGSSTAITILGTVATGTWEGTTVAVDQGGTGVTTMTALKNALDGETWSFANAVNIDATTSSINKTTGALIVDGGVGVAENIHAGGDVVAYASSDERLKDNLQVIQDPLDKVGQISGYEFDWNEKSPEWAQERGHDIGVVAQEIQKVHPEIVIERTNGYLGVDYKRIIPLLIESIKELKQEVEDLKKKVS